MDYLLLYRMIPTSAQSTPTTVLITVRNSSVQVQVLGRVPKQEMKKSMVLVDKDLNCPLGIRSIDGLEV